MRFEEVRKISIVIPVLEDEFYDDKEITTLFTYVFERSILYKSFHPRNTFRIDYDNNGKKICTFMLEVRADDDHIAKRKQELELLVDTYDITEREYIRFKAFGDIESRALIRKGTK